MKKITVKDILSKVPCPEWTEARLRKKIGKGKTLPEILDLSGVEDKDKIWCVIRFLDDKTNRAFAIWCARRCEFKVKEVTEYIDVIERYYNGKATKEELKKADSSSHWAADRAAYNAANEASYWAADRAAYEAAYWAAYNAADRVAERKKQVAYLRKVVEECNDTKEANQ
ncbi:MAG: hypothetical protein KKC68_06660 [Candidatus Thermoplasmatota archaeon]|nr:hypothetical protein [Candidatus Thermoplasmatota archaeon]